VRVGRVAAVGMLLVVSLAVRLASAAEPYVMNSVVLLQPQELVSARVSSVEELAAYMQALNAAAARALAGHAGSPSAGYVVVAVRPAGKAKIWLDLTPGISPELQRPLQAALDGVVPVSLKEGLVVFAINVSLWGAPQVTRLPQPPEWMQAIRPGNTESLDQMVDRIWPPRIGN